MNSLTLTPSSLYISIASSVVVLSCAFYLGRISASSKPTSVALRYLDDKGRKKEKGEGRSLLDDDGESGRLPKTLSLGELDVRRKCCIARGGPTDHAGEVVVSSVPNFDLNTTIFGSLPGLLPRTVQGSKVGVASYWSDACVSRVNEAYSKIPKPITYKSALVSFMSDRCDFAIEHADGSFMDHLKFCHDYTCQNYPDASPVPMLLHSIMGVGTNFFPMSASLIPDLQALITERDFVHVSSFPSVLRLILGTDFLKVLLTSPTLPRKVTFRRVIDNAVMSLEGDDVKRHLNYQLVHCLDFLPYAGWRRQMDDGFLKSFIELHQYLVAAGGLEARVQYDASDGSWARDGVPLTVGGILRGALPVGVAHMLARKAVRGFSDGIGHDLSYELVY
mmetsp:Transcript_26341/g.54893  ORF Transcript_26341/g.54893 Transcript_26341/m.54893 type:complete len:391 (+) Transcript_26341:24-1196(+)